MSRHRNFRSRQYSYDEDDLYDDYYDDYEDDEDTNYGYQNKQQQKQLVIQPKLNNIKNKDERKQQQLLSNANSSSFKKDINSASATLKSTTTVLDISDATSSAKDNNMKATSISKGGSGVISPPPGWERPLIKNSTAALITTVDAVSEQISPAPKSKPLSSAPDSSKKSNNIDPAASKEKKTATSTKIYTSSAYSSEPFAVANVASKCNVKSSLRMRLSMVVVGNVDHGKSTLMGQLLVLSNKVTQRTCDYYKRRAADIGKSSFALAWIMDEDDAERQRGVTMDVAQKTMSLSQNSYDLYILDAPGHSDFVPQMITGAALADVALLVYDIASSMNEKVIQEIVFITRGLGVSQLVVVINKMDLIEWNSQQYHAIIQKLQPLLVGTTASYFQKQQQRYFQKERVRYVPCSGWTGENLVQKTTAAAASWYKDGMTLVQALETFKPPIQQRHADKPLRFVIIDVYQEGNKISVRGKVVQGRIVTHDKAVVLPLGDLTTIFKIVHGDFEEYETTDKVSASAGDIVDLVLSDISDISRISPGSIICRHGDHGVVVPSQVAVANLVVMDNISTPIIRGTQVSFHMHSVDIPATITKLIETATSTTNTNSKPRIITGGASAIVELKLSERLCLEEYKECRALGRFVLRRGGETIAFGRIESLVSIKSK